MKHVSSVRLCTLKSFVGVPSHKQHEASVADLDDVRDVVKFDISHPSVLFCCIQAPLTSNDQRPSDCLSVLLLSFGQEISSSIIFSTFD